MASSAKSKLRGEIEKALGYVEIAHPVGHLHVTLNCANGFSFGTTSQTGSGSEYASAFDGLGASFRIFPGYLDDPSHVAADIKTREQSGKIAAIDIKVTGAQCRHLAGFLKEYQARGAHKFYGDQFRPRRFEGAGCTAFGIAFIELTGLTKCSIYTPIWSRNINIGIGRIADYKGDGEYTYGSNLIS